MNAVSSLWAQLFGNEHPVEVEIGAERGIFLLATAKLYPQRNYLGIERSTNRALRLEGAVRRSGLTNARALQGDAGCVIDSCVPPSSVAAYHIYFPDPWWKRRHHHRRLLTPEFATSLARSLEPEGTISLVTDVEELFRYSMRSLLSVPGLREDEVMPARPVRTVFETKALQRGSQLYGASLRRVDASAQRRSA